MPARRDSSWFLLLALFGVLVTVTVAWVSVDRRPPMWDHANHLERAIACKEILIDPGRDRLRAILALSSFYPPLVTCAAGVLYLWFPATPLTSQAVMLGFLGVGLLATFLLGKTLFDSRTGLLGALIFGTAPFVVFSTLNFQLDLPLAAMVVLAILGLVRSEGFSRRKWSWAVGVILAAGLLTKPPFAVYVLPPLALVALVSLRKGLRWRRLGNLAVALLLPSVLALLWYGPRLLGLPMQILNRSFKQAAESGYAETLSASSLAFYPLAFLPQFGVLAGVLFLWGLWAVRHHRSARALLWVSCLIPFGVFLFLQNKNLRYTLPILPLAALVAAGGLRVVPWPWRRVLVWVCVAVSFLQVGTAAFGVPPVPGWSPFNLPLVMHFPPSPAQWPHGRILALILEGSGGKPATVSVVPNENFFSVSNFRYYAVRDKLPLTFTRAWDDYPLEVDFVILKTGSQGPAFSVAKATRIMARLEAGDPPFEKAFPVIGEFPLPDGSVASVRRRHVAAVPGVAPELLARRLDAGARQFLARFARDVEGLEIRIAFTPAELLRGGIDSVHIRALRATIGEFSAKRPPLALRHIRATLEGLRVNPHRLLATGEVEPLALGTLRIHHLIVTEADLQAFLSRQRRLGGLRVSLGEGSAAVELSQPGPDLQARLRLSVPGRFGTAFGVEAEGVRLGGLPLPRGLVHWVLRNYDPTPRLSRLPVVLVLAPPNIRVGRIEIGSLDGSPSRRWE
jgi:hypothetical protein